MANEEVRQTNATTGGQKGSKIQRVDLIPIRPLLDLAEMYGHGAKKYAPRNWERGYDWSLSYAAMQRHAMAFWGGEDVIPQTPEGEDDDPTAGVHHLVAVAWHAFAMLEWTRTHPELDDRPLPDTLLGRLNALRRAEGNAPLTKLPGLEPEDVLPTEWGPDHQPLDASEITAAWGRAGEQPRQGHAGTTWTVPLNTAAASITEKLLQDAYDKLENPQRLPRCAHCDRLISTLGSHAKDCVVVAGIPVLHTPEGSLDESKIEGMRVIYSQYVPKGKAFIVNPAQMLFDGATPDFDNEQTREDLAATWPRLYGTLASQPPWGEGDRLNETVLDRIVSWVRKRLGR